MQKTLRVQLQEASDELSALQKQHAAVEAERNQAGDKVAELQSTIETLSGELGTEREIIKELEATVAAREGTIADLTAKLETALGDLEKAKHVAEDTLASIGHPAVTDDDATQASGSTREELWARYAEIQKTDPAEATRFYREHRATMAKPMRIN